jgi:hypothetical protein
MLRQPSLSSRHTHLQKSIARYSNDLHVWSCSIDQVFYYLDVSIISASDKQQPLHSPTKHHNLTKPPIFYLPQNPPLLHPHLHTNLIQTMLPIQIAHQLHFLPSGPRFFVQLVLQNRSTIRRRSRPPRRKGGFPPGFVQVCAGGRSRDECQGVLVQALEEAFDDAERDEAADVDVR